MQQEGERISRIRQKLVDKYAPTYLNIKDESHLHQGHAGARPEGETHFSLEIIAEGFSGLSRIASHRAIHAVLADEFATGLHALNIRASGPV